MKDLAQLAEGIERRCEQIAWVLGLDDERVALTVLELLSHDAPTLAAACEAEYVAMVRTASELAEDGYHIGAIPTEAVAALYAISAGVALGVGEGSPAALLEAQALAGEAVFMLGRAGTLDGTRADADRAAHAEAERTEAERREAVAEAEKIARTQAEQAEAERRKAAGSRGGRPRTFDDALLVQFMINWKRDRGSMRGSVKAASIHLNVTEKTIGSRLGKLRSKPA